MVKKTKSKQYVQDITQKTKDILGNKFVSSLLAVLGLVYLTPATAVPIFLISAHEIFTEGFAKGLVGSQIVKLLLKMGLVGRAPQFIALPVLLTIIANVSIAALDNFLFCFLKIINSSDNSGEVLKDQQLPVFIRFTPRSE